MHRLQALKAFEKWKTEFKSGNKTERTPETPLDWGTRPGEVYRFGEPCWSNEDYNKWLFSKDKNDTEFWNFPHLIVFQYIFFCFSLF